VGERGIDEELIDLSSIVPKSLASNFGARSFLRYPIEIHGPPASFSLLSRDLDRYGSILLIITLFYGTYWKNIIGSMI